MTSYRRPRLTARGPNRAAAGYYRSNGPDGGAGFGGGALQLASEDIAIAAIRAIYRITDAQIGRGLQMGADWREAAARAGAGDAHEIRRRGEELVRKTLGLGVEGLQVLRAQPPAALGRLEQTLQSLLNSTDPSAWIDLLNSARRLLGRDAIYDSPHARTVSAAVAPAPRIVFTAAARALELTRWQLHRRLDANTNLQRLIFRPSTGAEQRFEGALLGLASGQPPTLTLTLTLTLDATLPAGDWTAAVCDVGNELVGVVSIRLLV
jgi:hypothetical protein